jgi:hypothetical protein
MRSKRLASVDHDPSGVLTGLTRAAAAERRLSIETDTPFCVWENGRVVDLNAARRGSRSQRRRCRMNRDR